MKAVLLMFDSLRKNNLSLYNPDTPKTNSFDRIAAVSTIYNNFYVGSMPCIPARRDLQTGRYNFMHRSWGPMEPFDNSFPEILKNNSIYTHLVTDHKHYWREGGATYHVKFNTYEFIRGQEGDAWKGVIKSPNVKQDFFEPERQVKYKNKSRQQDLVNRMFIRSESDFPLVNTMMSGIEFIETNKDEDNWFLQIECFDPHEPFHVSDEFLTTVKESNNFGGWPPYGIDNIDQNLTQTIKNYYEALILMIDKYVGKLADTFDKHNLWEDTLLIINTDHGFLLGEHEWWGKNMMPIYNEVANIPLLIHKPGQKNMVHSFTLVQNINLAATILEYFNLEAPKEMIAESIQSKEKSNQNSTVAFGYFGSCLNATDGRYVYMRTPDYDKRHLFNEYTLMPTHINSMFSIKELKNASLTDPFNFTKGVPLLKIPSLSMTGFSRFGDKLYDLEIDKAQKYPIENLEIEQYFLKELYRIAVENDAPPEFFEIYGLKNDISIEEIIKHKEFKNSYKDAIFNNKHFENNSVFEGYLALIDYFSDLQDWESIFEDINLITSEILMSKVKENTSIERLLEVEYILNLQMRNK